MTGVAAGACMDFADFEGEARRTLPEDQPRPLVRDLPPAAPFPIDALGNILGSAAKAIHDRT